MTITQTSALDFSTVDYTQTEVFLKSFHPDGVVSFRTFTDSSELRASYQDKQDPLAKTIRGTLHECLTALQRLNQQGAGVYFIVNKTDGSSHGKSSITGINALFADCDRGEPDPKGMAKLPLIPSWVVQSKAGKHIYWLLEQDAISLKDFECYQVAIAKALGSDPVVKDLSRVLRVPGFYHMKDLNDPFMVSVVSKSPLKAKFDASCFEEIDMELNTPKVSQADTQAKASHEQLESELKQVCAYLKEVKTGGRNNLLNAKAYQCAGLVKAGMAEDTVIDTLVRAAMEAGLSAAEAFRAAHSGLAAGMESDEVKPFTVATKESVSPSRKSGSYNKMIGEKLRELYGGKLRLNSYSQMLELAGEPIAIEALHGLTEDQLDLDINYDHFKRRIGVLAAEAEYSPVEEYLLGLPTVEAHDCRLVNGLAKHLFGSDNPQEQIRLVKWLVGAVARALVPGCKMDTALVVKGEQGIGKTTFFAVLFGDYFKTLHSDVKGVERIRILRQAWCAEMGEIESVFRSQDNSQMKAFLSETTDTYRKLYIEAPQPFPRHTVFSGTTNEAAFLSDSTGSRRYWLIDAGSHKIPLDWLQDNRDRLWAEVLSLYRSGLQWWLTDVEQELSERQNQDYQVENSFVEPLEQAFSILSNVYGNVAITSTDTLKYLLGIKEQYSGQNQAAIVP